MTENHDEVRNVLLLKIAICGYYDVTKIDMFVWLDFTTTYHMAMVQKATWYVFPPGMSLSSCSRGVIEQCGDFHLLIKMKFQWAIISKFNIAYSVVNGPFFCSMCRWPMVPHYPNHWLSSSQVGDFTGFVDIMPTGNVLAILLTLCPGVVILTLFLKILIPHHFPDSIEQNTDNCINIKVKYKCLLLYFNYSDVIQPPGKITLWLFICAVFSLLK